MASLLRAAPDIQGYDGLTGVTGQANGSVSLPTFDTVTNRSGLAAFKFATTTGTTSYTLFSCVGSLGSTIYIRGYFYATSLASFEGATLLQASDSGSNNIAAISINGSGFPVLQLWESGTQTTIATGSTALVANTWQRIDLAVNVPVSGNTMVTGYLNDTQFGTGAAATGSNAAVSYVAAGIVAGTTNQTVWGDDIGVNDSTGSAQNGPLVDSQIIYLNAISDVSSTGTFVNGAGTINVYGKLKVVNVGGSNQLQTFFGSQFIARGVTEWAIADNGDNASANSNFATTEWSDLSTVISVEKANGVNMVRCRLLAGYYNSLSSSAKTAYVNQVVTRLTLAKQQGAILLLTLWDGTDPGPSGYDYSGANMPTEYTNLYPLIEAVSTAIGNDPNVIWNPINEPNDGGTGTFTWSLWQTVFKNLINCLRTTCGYTGVIVVDPLNWANSGANGLGYSNTDYTAIETYDAGLLGGQHQIVFSVHQYWYPSWSALSQGTTAGWSTSRFTGTVLGGTTTHCILGTEIGNDNDGGNASVGTSNTWSSNIVTALANLPATMPNWAGMCNFLQDWVDDNTIYSLTDRTTATTWGNTVVNNNLKGPNYTAPDKLYASANNIPFQGQSVGSATLASQIIDATNNATDNFVAATQLPPTGTILTLQGMVSQASSNTTALTNGVSLTANPVVAETTGSTGTTAAGVFPTGWTTLRTAPVYNPTVTSAPQVKFRRGSGAASAMVEGMGVIVEYTTVAPPVTVSSGAFFSFIEPDGLGGTSGGGVPVIITPPTVT